MKRHYYFTNQTVHRHRAREMELKIEKETGLRLENPFYDGEHKEIADLDAGRPIKITADEIVGADLRKIREADGILALMSSFKNVGSAMEIALAAQCWGKPVFVIATKEALYNHPWIVHYATRRFRSAKEFIQWYHKEGYAIG